MSIKNFTKQKEVFVYKNNIKAGILYRTERGAVFEYLDEYLNSNNPNLSFHITKVKKLHNIEGENLHPFFAGLLPEGLRLNALVDNLKTSTSDLFSILLASGSDVIGDVYVKDSLNKDQNIEKLIKEDFAKVNFYELFSSSITNKGIEDKELNSYIPGIQPKISAQMISFPVSIAKKRKRYILKLEPEKFPNLIHNEYFFMNLAKKCGLITANVEIVKDSENNLGLLVERFDRIYDKDKKSFFRAHQEDACQFLNLYPQDKYRLNMREVAKGIYEHTTAPIIEISKLIDLLIYSYIICNGDLHAKNISLIYNQDYNNITLAPAYDLLSTLPYGDDTMALDFEGKNKNFTKKMFFEFSDSFDIPNKIVEKSIKKISSIIKKNIADIELIGFNAKKTTFLIKTIENRVESLM